MKHLITIIGPTAIGKTALSIQLANHYNCEIVSCDSRQFFKEMTIGTAVPNSKELAAAKHHFIQNKSIFENYTVGDFEKEAIATIEELFKTNDYVVLVGGSGLYVNAILKGFDDFPEIDATIRQEVNANYEKLGIGYLQDELKKLDPDYFEKITVENPQTLLNPQRMMRFVEVCIGTGKPYSSFLNQKKNERSFTPILIGLEAERNVMYNRINQRVDIMMNEGLLQEAKNLYPNKELNALQTVGYRELFSYFDKEYSLEFAIEEIKKNTRRFAKRQLTWFKRDENTKWFNYLTDKEKIIDFIKLKA
ncbi:tRNA dimethylallyltransferase [Flavobacterium glycines]|uniref:tRNA dimethylallyltransferase n=1 Tax=Flavobacterium glycines TaxID=551990 RepID=A0A1B9DZD6_9FLAO|nr:tRNA (adenosine(37)-N6)-dimethylallyltransferase MiaA [Flavobacterium glycines]OCB75053.1 tRNA (adenosine(37)-N6)-dimethylallyltransferase MiaA [Flavobacterium glycines]GEL11350.1 tRNA dimethylallyltransferase [Flavobacterium glycines]SDJ40712.1 tRNA dimethylallyltransferase [Flavobacterium glycines]